MPSGVRAKRLKNKQACGKVLMHSETNFIHHKFRMQYPDIELEARNEFKMVSNISVDRTANVSTVVNFMMKNDTITAPIRAYKRSV